MIHCNLVASSVLLLSLSVIGTTNGSELQCVQRIRVPRNTVFRARVMTVLKINCTITRHGGCHRNPQISWCKIYENHCQALKHSNYMETEWKNVTEHEGMAFLTFLKLSMEDAGLYRCREGDNSVGHAINVTVTADKQDEFSLNPSITSMAITKHDIISSMPIIGEMNTSPKNDLQWVWPYLCICAGIAGLVLVMAITLLYVVRCQGRKSTGKDMACKNQCIKTQKGDLLLPPHLCLDSDLLTSVIYRV